MPTACLLKIAGASMPLGTHTITYRIINQRDALAVIRRATLARPRLPNILVSTYTEPRIPVFPYVPVRRASRTQNGPPHG